MLDRAGVIAHLETVEADGELNHIPLDDAVTMVVTRLTEQRKQPREGLNHSRAYFLVNFTLVRWLRRLLADRDVATRFAPLTTETIDALRVATRLPLITERKSQKAGAGSMRVSGNVTPDVLTAYRSSLAAIGNACAIELQNRALELEIAESMLDAQVAEHLAMISGG